MLLLLLLLSAVYLWLAERDPRVACLAGWMDGWMVASSVLYAVQPDRPEVQNISWWLSISHSVAANKTEEESEYLMRVD